MKPFPIACVCVLSLFSVCLAGCNKPDQKKAKAEQEATKDGMRDNPGAYTPAPLNTSMTPRATPGKTEDPK